MSAVEETAFKRIDCLYLPADSPNEMGNWYAKHFNLRAKPNSDNPKLPTITLNYCEPGVRGTTSNYLTDDWSPGEIFEMFAVCFESDCIEELYKRLIANEVRVDPLKDEGDCGLQFCYYDPQGNKFLVWQDPKTVARPMRDGVPALIRVASIYFPVTDKHKTFKWYTETVGMPVSQSGQPRTGSHETFFFCHAVQAGQTANFYTPGWSSGGEVKPIVNIEVTGLDPMFRRLAEQGELVSYKINDAGGCGRSFKLYDPDHNMLELWGGFPA